MVPVSVLFYAGVDHNPSHPAFKRSLEAVLADFVENGYETFLKSVLGIFVTIRIPQADRKQLRRKQLVYFSLCFSFVLLTFPD